MLFSRAAIYDDTEEKTFIVRAALLHPNSTHTN